jgi:hypothetical protein
MKCYPCLRKDIRLLRRSAFGCSGNVRIAHRLLFCGKVENVLNVHLHQVNSLGGEALAGR